VRAYAGRPVSRPLAPEEDLARALLDANNLIQDFCGVLSWSYAPAALRLG